MDKVALGQRLAEARENASMTQEGLGRAVGLDRTAITRLEKGERKLSVPELVAVAKALGRPLAFFLADPVPSAVSRRRDSSDAHASTRVLDAELEHFASDVRTLLSMELLAPAERDSRAHTPANHPAAESLAASVRSRLQLGDEPIADLGAVSESLGLCVYSAPLGEGGPDGGCVEVTDSAGTIGAAILNGQAPAGRRRMTLAHELGHWLCGDAYDTAASLNNESMISSFAIHLLAPRGGVRRVWAQHPQWTDIDRALAVGARFRLSWSATIGQLRNLGLIRSEQYGDYSAHEPRSGDYVRLGLAWTEELESPYVSPSYAAACVNGYVQRRLTAGRAIELLRGTLNEEDLPSTSLPTLADMRSSFEGHGE